MSYCAYHQVTKIIDKGEGHDELIMEPNSHCTVENLFFLCSAYEPDKIDGPWSLVEAKANDSDISSDSEVFSWSKEDLDDLVSDIKEQFPDHEDTPEVLKEIQAIRDREIETESNYDFVCF